MFLLCVLGKVQEEGQDGDVGVVGMCKKGFT
jgi:hypothetical protein